MRISEVAAQTGFSTGALRYYESIGLLPPPARSDTGYRLYDERAVELLRFVGRAKALGLTLDEMRELAALWAADECRPVQARLTELLRGKQAAARARICELQAFDAELGAVAGALAATAHDGRCDERCACAAEPAPQTHTGGDAIVCTLPVADIPDRLGAWRALMANATATARLDDGARVEFGHGVPAETIASLAAAEWQCCAFFRFTVVIDDRGVALEVRAPAGAQPMVDALITLAPRR
jgi:DNA-binding transcriptional MerR regulator